MGILFMEVQGVYRDDGEVRVLRQDSESHYILLCCTEKTLGASFL